MNNSKKNLLGSSLLMTAAILWGFSFSFQSMGVDACEPTGFNGIRMLLGAVVLIPVILIFDGIKKKKGEKVIPFTDKYLLKAGIICGLVLTVASTLQNYGLAYTTAGKSGFLTAMYILFVPLNSMIIFKTKTSKRLWLCVAIAIAGMYLLCLSGEGGINKGDILTLLCAVGYSFHIIYIGRFSPNTDGIKMSCIQFVITGVLCTLFSVIFENPTIASYKAAIVPILYSGICSSGIAFTLQIIAQKYLNAVLASIISSFESVFALIGGIILLNQTPSVKELFGCILMFAAMIIAQLPDKKQEKNA